MTSYQGYQGIMRVMQELAQQTAQAVEQQKNNLNTTTQQVEQDGEQMSRQLRKINEIFSDTTLGTSEAPQNNFTQTSFEDKRMVKFETLINTLNSCLVNKYKSTFFVHLPNDPTRSGVYTCQLQASVVLATIYDISKLNQYGEFIFCNAFIAATSSDIKPYLDNGISAMNNIVSNFRGTASGYMFMFWALMILAVDDTEKEEHLTMICDYSKILNITEDEMLDLVNVVKYVFKDPTFQDIQTSSIKRYFGVVLELYA